MNQTDKNKIPLQLRYIDKQEAAEYLNCSPQFINAAVANGLIKGFQPLRKLLRFKISELDSFMQQSRQAPSR
jgi:excisionase family DNA binding protein